MEIFREVQKKRTEPDPIIYLGTSDETDGQVKSDENTAEAANTEETAETETRE